MAVLWQLIFPDVLQLDTGMLIFFLRFQLYSVQRELENTVQGCKP